ncbi:MAG: phage portal protein [Ignavibacteria bacterium]|jgi:HK97 family phage portal protein|nr:phage portal protein [Ignavibacteria bacterium]MCU7504685.1 phage portal protein [Ignavibacteria bacterium]MCU7516287.1 phage portal protein [Ignavibacteria bacterium]
MKLYTRLLNGFLKLLLQSGSSFNYRVSKEIDLPGSSPGLSRFSQKQQLYNEIRSWVFSAIALRSEDVAKTAFRLYRRSAKNGRTVTEEVPDHPFVHLFYDPGYDLSWYELMLLTVQNMDATGDMYWLLERNRMNVISRLHPILPEYLKIIPGENDLIKSYVYKSGQQRIDIAKEDIIHFKHQKAGDLFYGQSIILAIADIINVNNLELAFQVESFNQPVPPVSLETDKDLGLELARELQEQFRAKYGGLRRTSSVPVLDNGLKLNIHKTSARELDFSASRKNVRDEILGAFRVPASKLGIVADVNRANAEAANFTYLSNAIEPLCRYFSIKFTQLVQREFGEFFFVMHDDVVPRDLELRLKYYENGRKYGWLSSDEIRQEEGYGI